ncbi:MAG: c-type cytochrome [Phycisphaerales bacterium JB039]
MARAGVAVSAAVAAGALAAALWGQGAAGTWRHAGEPRGTSAPVLSPAEALASFRIADGLRIELVAAEPLIEDPIAIAFDADGRLWALEMRSYMPNVEGEHELMPTSRIVRLEDHDGDGQMDEAITFLDGLVLARAIAPVHGGLLVLAPPELQFWRDTDGDGRADRKVVLQDGFAGLENPEHAPNGLLYGLDNWIHFTQHTEQIRFDGERIVETARTPGHGQWGITQDTAGRLYYTPNSEALRGDRLPKIYAARNGAQSGRPWAYQRIVRDTETWPIRPTPGVNRGYLDGVLREDKRLWHLTAACAPVIYEAGTLPGEYRGDAFICEPAGNLVKRLALEEGEDRQVNGSNAYDGVDWWTSTDERFRPVNTCVGPDGALYVADMYRGVIQHRTYVTDYLKEQIRSRNLETPLGLGRIWRVVPEEGALRRPERLSSASDERLVELLADSDLWWRITAQRLLIERAATGVEALLRSIAGAHEQDEARLHALWTLDGLGLTTPADARAAMEDPWWAVRAAGCRIAERWIDDSAMRAALVDLAADDVLDVRAQAAMSIGMCRSDAALDDLLAHFQMAGADGYVRAAILSGLRGRELALARRIWEQSAQLSSAEGAMLGALFDCALQSGSAQEATALAELIGQVAAQRPDVARIGLDRLGAALRVGQAQARVMELTREPAGWSELVADSGLGERATACVRLLSWPGKPVEGPLGRVRALTEAERALFERGSQLYTYCSQCHGMEGEGQEGRYPALAGSLVAQGPPEILARMMIHGVEGRWRIGDEVFTEGMVPAQVPMDAEDESIAAILTYVRRSWGNLAEPVAPDLIAHERARWAGRERPWTQTELEITP